MNNVKLTCHFSLGRGREVLVCVVQAFFKWHERQSSSNTKSLLTAILFAIKYRMCEHVVVSSPLLRLEFGLLCFS